MYGHECATVCVKVRGHLAGFQSLLLLYGFWESNSGMAARALISWGILPVQKGKFCFLHCQAPALPWGLFVILTHCAASDPVVLDSVSQFLSGLLALSPFLSCWSLLPGLFFNSGSDSGLDLWPESTALLCWTCPLESVSLLIGFLTIGQPFFQCTRLSLSPAWNFTVSLWRFTDFYVYVCMPEGI